jgi:hypothetical protein
MQAPLAEDGLNINDSNLGFGPLLPDGDIQSLPSPSVIFSELAAPAVTATPLPSSISVANSLHSDHFQTILTSSGNLTELTAESGRQQSASNNSAEHTKLEAENMELRSSVAHISAHLFMAKDRINTLQGYLNHKTKKSGEHAKKFTPLGRVLTSQEALEDARAAQAQKAAKQCAKDARKRANSERAARNLYHCINATTEQLYSGSLTVKKVDDLAYIAQKIGAALPSAPQNGRCKGKLKKEHYITAITGFIMSFGTPNAPSDHTDLQPLFDSIYHRAQGRRQAQVATSTSNIDATQHILGPHPLYSRDLNVSWPESGL